MGPQNVENMKLMWWYDCAASVYQSTLLSMHPLSNVLLQSTCMAEVVQLIHGGPQSLEGQEQMT